MAKPRRNTKRTKRPAFEAFLLGMIAVPVNCLTVALAIQGRWAEVPWFAALGVVLAAMFLVVLSDSRRGGARAADPAPETPAIVDDAEVITSCAACTREWAVTDVEAVLTAKTHGNRWLGVSIAVLVAAVGAAGFNLLVSALIAVLGVGVGVWSVIVNRRPLRSMASVPLDDHHKQRLKDLDRTTLKLGAKMLRESSATRAGVLYFSLTRGLAMRLFFLAAIPFTVAWFAVAGYLQRRFQSETRCPGCLELRVAINFLPKDKQQALQELRAM